MLNRLLPKNHPDHTLGEAIRMLSAGPGEVVRFESAFVEAVGARYGVAFPHCRVAIRTALQALRPPGHFVVVTAYTCIVVPHAIVLAGFAPRFVDIDPIDYNSHGEALLEAIDDRVGAVVTTQMYGTPVRMEALERGVARPLLIIEDAALSLHAAYRPPGGNLRAATVYSFDHNKILSTVSGGMLVTHDRDLADRVRALRDADLDRARVVDRFRFLVRFLGMTCLFHPTAYAAFDRLRDAPGVKGLHDTRESMDAPAFPRGAQLGMDPMQASLGFSQMAQRGRFLETRIQWARRYAAALPGISDLVPMPFNEGSHFSHYAVRIPERDRRRFRERMREAGVEAGRTLDYAIPEIPYYRPFAHRAFPLAARAAREVINLPNYPSLTEREFQRVLSAVAFAAGQGRPPALDRRLIEG